MLFIHIFIKSYFCYKKNLVSDLLNHSDVVGNPIISRTLILG